MKLSNCRDNKTISIIDFVKKIVDESYKDPNLSLNFISQKLKMSSIYVGTIFKKIEAMSIADYIQNVRIEAAARLLVETKKSISVILDDIGWENKKYFNTIFKKHYSVTPSMYRLNKTVNG